MEYIAVFCLLIEFLNILQERVEERKQKRKTHYDLERVRTLNFVNYASRDLVYLAVILFFIKCIMLLL